MEKENNSNKIIGKGKGEEEKRKYWKIAIGLQEVDDLQPSSYLLLIKEKNISGAISNNELEELIESYYKICENVKEEEYICDIVSNRIVALLEMNGQELSPTTLQTFHKYLFNDLYSHAGKFRNMNISKEEPILNGDTVKYTNYYSISTTLEFDFQLEKDFSYSDKTHHEIVKNISDFTSSIWQVHPFFEGNTRTTAIFILQYLKGIGFQVNDDIFVEYSKYFRNALVRDNYTDDKNGINKDSKYLRKFFTKLLFEPGLEIDKEEISV